MDDYHIEQAIEGLIKIAESNFPTLCDITLSTSGPNTASIRVPTLALRGLLSFAREARDAKQAGRVGPVS